MAQQSTFFEQLNRERSLADFVPFSSHIDPTTIVTKDGDLLRCWKLAGLSFETADAEDIHARKEQLNTLLRAIASPHVALWTHTIHRKTSDRLSSHFSNAFCREFDQKYFDSFADYPMMSNELYLTILYRPEPRRLGKAFVNSARRSHDQILQAQRHALSKLNDIAYQIESGLRRYGADEGQNAGPQALTCYTQDGIVYSETLSLFNYLLSGTWQKVRVPAMPLYDYLGTAWVFVGVETIEVRTATASRFAQCIDFKDYATHTEPGLLNGLMYAGYEFVMTQSFSFMSTRTGKKFLETQLHQLANTEDGSISQIQELTEAVDQLIQGKFAMGEYHFSLMVFGDSIEQVRRNTTSAMTVIQNQGFLAALVATATDAAFYAQLPGNWHYRPRIAGLTSRNFAGLSSFHNFRCGKRDGNPWGQAVTLFKTASGQPLYFNFHYSKGDEDAFDRKVLGNTRLIGQSGSGKTVLLNMLLIQSQKYQTAAPAGFTTVFFDKDEGAKLCIKAIGGQYLSIKNGQPTGFNPFQMEKTEANLLFLERLIRTLVASDGHLVTTFEELRITRAVRTVMDMPKPWRRLSTLLQNMTESHDKDARDNSLVKRLSRWCADDGNGRCGQLWWVFDCPQDQIDFTIHHNYGFDGTHFLDNPDVRTPISMYLLHRMEAVIDGRRFIYFMDEAWKWVDDEAFAEFAGNKQLTIRKKNGLGVFATQMPSSLLKSKIAAALVQQTATEIYLPNPKADFEEYVHGFKVSVAEFELIRAMGEESRLFLIKQGHQSMIGRLDLHGFDDELAILSGSTDNIELVDSLIAEVGDDPAVWLPMFQARRKARANAIYTLPAQRTPS